MRASLRKAFVKKIFVKKKQKDHSRSQVFNSGSSNMLLMYVPNVPNVLNNFNRVPMWSHLMYVLLNFGSSNMLKFFCPALGTHLPSKASHDVPHRFCRYVRVYHQLV